MGITLQRKKLVLRRKSKMALRSLKYQKKLTNIISELEYSISGFYVSKDCVGKICPIDKCGQDATHKINEEMLDEEPNPERNNLTSHVCCEHYQSIFGFMANKQCKENAHPVYNMEIDKLDADLVA